jgi:hypothetical protein
VAVYSSVTVAPPSEMDLSGWTLLQRTETGFETTFTIPDGTVLKEGHYLFVARDSSVTQFSQAWGLDPAWFSGPNAVLHHVNGGEGFPNVDGKHEKFELKNGDSIVDGPTIRMSALGVYGFVRIPGGSAGAIKSWWADLMSNYTIGPGMGAPTPSKPAGLYISVIADTATGHDWVEIFFDAYP